MHDLSATENTVDAIWSAGSDGRWRRGLDFAKIVSKKREHVMTTLEFLVRYGFAESIDRGETLFRMVAESPSPSEAAELLTSVRSG